MEQGRSALPLFWNAQFQPHGLPVLTSPIFIYTIMGQLCGLYYYSLRASDACDVYEPLTSQQFPVWVTSCRNGLCVKCNSTWDSLLVDLWPHSITMGAEFLAVERAVCLQNLALQRLMECSPLICLQHGASLKLKWCSWLQKIHCRGDDVSECQSELFPSTPFAGLL